MISGVEEHNMLIIKVCDLGLPYAVGLNEDKGVWNSNYKAWDLIAA